VNTGDEVKAGRSRVYRAPRRDAAAAATREAILRAAQERFEAMGWSGATIAGIAAAAEVSPKTVEALHGTKAALLAAVVSYAIRGDTDTTPMIDRSAARAVEAAPDAAAMLARHIDYLVPITSRSARLAFVVESAAGSDERVSEVWQQMTHNRRFGASWAAKILLARPGVRAGLTLAQASRHFLVAIDWATWRTLSDELGLTERQVRAWLTEYYRQMFLVG
jgi:AcrR family transcriptional regulator